MRVLGVDPGLTRCGVGIIDGAVGSPLSLVEVGVILTPVDAPLEQRLLDLDQQLSQWLNLWKPDVVAVERVFSQHNVRTVMGTGQAAGVALLLAAKAGIPVMMHTPSEVKASVTGNGRANKAQVAMMVQKVQIWIQFQNRLMQLMPWHLRFVISGEAAGLLDWHKLWRQNNRASRS